jgi:hypothetical protein
MFMAVYEATGLKFTTELEDCHQGNPSRLRKLGRISNIDCSINTTFRTESILCCRWRRQFSFELFYLSKGMKW